MSVGSAAATPVLPESVWTARRERHRDRVARLLGPHLRHRAAGIAHPVHDFLFTYYRFRPGQLRRWHPGFGTVLVGERAAGYLEYPDYEAVRRRDLPSGHRTAVTVSPAVLVRRRRTVEFVADLLTATAARSPHLGCFGLHEWAMVYRSGPDALRHRGVPLRLGRAGTDAVLESLPLRCTHFDAFRFFTPDGAARNATVLRRQDQPAHEQPGCLHAGMDLYKWCGKLVPLVDSELWLDCFELAADARVLDMRASPYDLTDYGYSPVTIETAAGRAQYVREQSALTARASALRAELLHRCVALLGYRTDPSGVPAAERTDETNDGLRAASPPDALVTGKSEAAHD